MPSTRVLGVGFALLSFSCVDQQEATDAAKKVAENAAPALEKGKELAGEGMDKAKPHIEKGIEKGAEVVGDKAKELFADIPDTGELSDKSMAWIESAAKSEEEAADGAESWISKGTQLAPVALEIAKVVNESVDKDYMIEPIYMEIGDEKAQAELDAKLAKLPKTQEIDGVKVGFKRLTESSSEKKVDESAYLVIWRRDDHLVGFVYRSRSEIDVDKLAAETPRLIGAVNGVLAQGDK